MVAGTRGARSRSMLEAMARRALRNAPPSTTTRRGCPAVSAADESATVTVTGSSSSRGYCLLESVRQIGEPAAARLIGGAVGGYLCEAQGELVHLRELRGVEPQCAPQVLAVCVAFRQVVGGQVDPLPG